MKAKNSKSRTKSKAMTASKLAQMLGVSRQLIAAHRKHPGAPKLQDVAGWTLFLAERGRAGSAPPELRQAIAQARLGILNETKSRLARENAVADGEMMLVSDARRQAAEAWGFLFSALQQGRDELPPQLAGLDAQEVDRHLTVFIERLRIQAKVKFDDVAGKLSDADIEVEVQKHLASHVAAACGQRAFSMGESHLWQSFMDWKRKDEAEAKAGRAAWCASRAKSGQPVPDATDAELAQFPGLRRA